MARVGEPAPRFELPCTQPGPDQPDVFRLADHLGRWVLVVFYPRDFSGACPTEITSINARFEHFAERDCSIVAISTDPIETHLRWQRGSPSEGGVGKLSFPLASDADGRISRAYGVYDESSGAALRGLFVIDPEGVVQFQRAHRFCIGRGATEPLAILDGLRSVTACPFGWRQQDEPPAVSRSVKRGGLVGGYRVDELIGQGAFSEVYRARDMTLDRSVALKILRPGTVIDLEYVLHEARTAAKIDHPNICTIYGVAEEDGVPLIAMQLVDGRTLTEILGQEGPMDLDDVRRMGRQIASAMAACHARGVVHGDVKPGNVMIDDSGLPLILDFGIATSEGLRVMPPRRSDDGESSTVDPPLPPGTTRRLALSQVRTRCVARAQSTTRQSADAVGGVAVCGTPSYMAPELLFGDAPTPATDVFAFGATLFEALTGHKAFDADSAYEVAKVQQATDHETLRDRLPEEMRFPVMLCLARDPLLRTTMAELIRLL
jgi:eukaryotic-like serine/threonine-protein kinase